ncbi:MAG: hypothetical protein K6U04_12245 [Armatimonadetes bacterium]|nr:hypothetical protein [Armatimonadota bacterium]
MYAKIYHKRIRLVVSVLVFLFIFSMLAGCGQKAAEETATDRGKFRVVKDMRGKEVKIPQDIQRVATISDGLIESTMISFGVIDRLVGIGSECVKKNFKYEFETYKGDSFEYLDGMNPVAVLYPIIGDIPVFAKSGTAVNFETLASLNPDLIIIRVTRSS